MTDERLDEGHRPTNPDAEARTSLRELALLFFRLGATGFGGPAAHVAMIHDEVVVRRRWLDEERFLDLLGATNLIPGPSSTEMAIHVGWARRRWAGLVVAGVAFILPAMLITGALGAFYVRFGSVPEVRSVLYGVQPVMLGIVAQAFVSLAPKAARTARLRALGALAVVAAAFGVHELVVLLGTGVFALATSRARADEKMLGLAPLLSAGATTGAAAAGSPATLASIFWVFCKTGSVLFGSGYVLLAFLRSDLVERLGWLTDAQLLDAIAVGQVTPGPVFTTATFVGYLLAGPGGALVATLGIFLPAFVFVAISGPLVPRIRSSKAASAILDGVNVSSLALMLVVTAQLARSAIVDPLTLVLAVASALLLVRYRINSAWIVLGGGVVGALAGALR